MAELSSPIPENDTERVKALKSYQILDSAPENEYDAITKLASYICQVPMAAITLIDSDRQWLKSKIGLDITETPRAEAFCRYTILDDKILEVPDTLQDEKFAGSEYVNAVGGIRFYAGAPLIDNEGYRLGSLCVIDNKPRKLTAEQREALAVLSNEVISHLSLRKQKMELEATLAKYRDFFNLFNNSPDIHCIADSKANVEVANSALAHLLHVDFRAVPGKAIWEFFINEGDKEQFRRHIAKKSSFEFECLVNVGFSEPKWIDWCVSFKQDKWYISGRDISYQKKILADLQQLSLVASKMSNGVAIMDADNRAIWINGAFEEITGFSIKDIAGKQLSEFLEGDYNISETRQRTIELLKSEKNFSIHLHVNRKDGAPIWLSVTSSVVFDEQGQVQRYIKVIKDITDRKHAEQQLNILSFAARKSPGGILIRDKDGRVIWMNESFEQITGYSLSEMQGKTFGTTLLGERTDMSVFQKALEAVQKNQPYEVEILVYRKDKMPIWILINNSPILNVEGEVERQVGVITDITERKEAEQQLKLLSLVASNTISGVVINDENGDVEWVNQAFTNITGYSIKDVAGRHLGDILKGELTDVGIIEKARELSDSKQSFEVDLLVYRKDGKPLWISVINSAILDDSGKVEKYVEVIIDISAKKKTELDLIAAKEEALQLSRAKEMFISVMSHEIRTPLNAVIGISNLLANDNADLSQQENLSILKFSAENLMSLINDVLDFTKIETGNVKLEKINVNLREVVRSLASSMQFRASEKNIYLKYNIDEALPEIIIGDRTRLVQILLNLISNAVKFTETGGVEIDVRVLEQNETTARIRFAVTDTGIGIAPDKINSIFELWKQAEDDTTRKFGGTGLGLAISERLVTLHDSRINVDSVLGKGTTFWFTIGFDKTTNKALNNNKVDEELKLHLLVVDDNQINRLLINKVAKKWGATADFAENGAEAVDKILQNKNYDVVLMDIHMPIMGGLEATKTVRALPDAYFQQLPIIALTASMLTDQMGEIGNAGMNDYVLKPFDPKVLYDKLARYQKH